MPVFNFEAFKKITKEAGDTRQSQVVARTGLDSGLVSRILNDKTGRRREPNLATAVALADAYRVPLDELVHRKAAA